MTNLDDIEKKYREKEIEIQKEISRDFDSVLNEIYSKYEKDFRDMGDVKREKEHLKGRISELKFILRLFHKEIKILTRNKKRALKQSLKEMNRKKEEEIKNLEESIS